MKLMDPQGNWTYGDDPENSTRDLVRLESGDCIKSMQICSDNEVDYAISVEPSSMLAAARVSELAMRKLSSQTDESAEGYSAQVAQRYEQFKSTAEDLRAKYGHDSVPYAGGISAAETTTWKQDTDLIQPYFERGMFDHTGTPTSDDAEDT